MNPPQKTKIPTDEEILEGWAFYQTNRRIEQDSLLDLVRQARAAGRAEGAEEQREKDAEICEYRTDGNIARAIGGLLAKAIREQGEVEE